MNVRTENLLKNLLMRSRTAKFFTHNSAFLGLTEDMMTSRLEAVVATGWATREKGLFTITEAGRAALAQATERKTAEAKTTGPFKGSDTWKAPAWHTRAGSEDHKRIPSRGF